MDLQSNIILSMTKGLFMTNIIYAACNVGIFDKLYKNPKTLNSLSEDVDIDLDTLNRLIRPLISDGIIEIGRDKTLLLTTLGDRLSKYDENSMVDFISFNIEESAKYWEKITEALRKKVSPHELLTEKGFFNDQINNKTKYESFNKMMRTSSINVDITPYFKESNEENSFLKIIDVGGGAGDVISKFLEFYKNSKGVVYDLLHVKDECEGNLQNYNLLNRCSFKECNFFNMHKEKADIFILSRVLHDWSDNKCKKILDGIYENMDCNSKLLIIEKILPENFQRESSYLYMTDIYMWVICGGKERTEKEFDRLLFESGLKKSKIVKISMDEYIIEVIKDNYDIGEL